MSIPAHAKQYLGRIPFFHHKASSSLTLCFIPGFRSSFQASLKADQLLRWTQQHNVGFLTWDHDAETSIQDWCQQGQDIITKQLLPALGGQHWENNEKQQKHRVLFVGASLGAWLAIRIAHNLINCIGMETNKPLVVHGLIGIGGTVDSTERWLQELNGNTTVAAQPQIVLEDGVRIWRRPSKYARQGYYEIPVSFLETSRPSLLFGPSNDITEVPYPVHLIHGVLDQDVPLSSVHHLLHWIRSRQPSSSTAATAHLHLIEDGNHRLSRPQDLGLLDKVLITCIQDGHY